MMCWYSSVNVEWPRAQEVNRREFNAKARLSSCDLAARSRLLIFVIEQLPTPLNLQAHQLQS